MIWDWIRYVVIVGLVWFGISYGYYLGYRRAMIENKKINGDGEK